LGNTCYYSFRKIFSSKTLRIKAYENNNIVSSLDGCEIWFLTLRKEHKLQVFERSGQENIWT